MLSMAPDAYSNLPYTMTNKQKLQVNALNLLNKGSFYVNYYDDLKKDAIGEPYYFFQDAYNQQRESLIQN